MVEESPFYIGLGFGEAYVNDDFTDEEISSATLMLQAGYQYNEYLALEAVIPLVWEVQIMMQAT